MAITPGHRSPGSMFGNATSPILPGRARGADRLSGMETVPHDPDDGIYPSDDYIHALEVRSPGRMLFVAGTMGLDPMGEPAETLEGQLSLIWANIRTILASADMTVDNVVRVTAYLRDSAYAEANAQARLEALGGRKVPTTAIVAETLAEDWLVEIEVIAAA
jgi:2-iminobutanoate/2-iminopropanoate deaminase